MLAIAHRSGVLRKRCRLIESTQLSIWTLMRASQREVPELELSDMHWLPLGKRAR
jgi:hypothetical protein